MYIKKEHSNFKSEEEIRYYFERYNSGDLNAKDIIIESYICLVFKIVNTEFNVTPFDKDDLICVGIEGLIKGVHTFDLSKNISFYTYAQTCILNEIRYYIRTSKKHLGNDSLDRVIVFDDNFSFKLQDTLIDENIDIENEYITDTIIVEALDIIENLPDREKKAICMFFGVCGYERYTQKEIAQQLNITQPGFSRLISRTLTKIRNIIDCDDEPIKKPKQRKLVNNKK